MRCVRAENNQHIPVQEAALVLLFWINSGGSGVHDSVVESMVVSMLGSKFLLNRSAKGVWDGSLF